ncbi:MAG TPA: RagB/SusD family nutrient uptake outer membrane protein [Prolixibacteraceae bacterium]|nr:RagB/SusD family nutrient uptake outer membrane protein [Prolixibacteraceae bacterium]
MKKLIIFFILPILAGFVVACHDIEVPITTQMTPDVFPQNDEQYTQTAGAAYATLRGNYALDYHFITTLSTDEGILPARGGNWYDNQNYSKLHYHNWDKDHGWTNSAWSWLERTIGVTNQASYILNANMPEGSNKMTTLAELRMVRAISYFMLMDLYGNVPLDTLYGDFTPRTNTPRAEVFNFIESEVKKSINGLSDQTGIATYGRPNKYTAYALLAKMYLNAEYYTGTKRYDDCIAACDQVIGSGKYAIESRSSYLQMFYPDNGPQMKEFIFAIPYDPSAVAAPSTNSNMYFARYDVPRSEQAKFGIPFKPSAPMSTLPEFYSYFNDAGDIRNDQWLTGLQFMNDGVTPITVTTTKKGYDQFYTGADGADAYTYQVNLTPDIILRQNPDLFDCGNDEIAWNIGYRNIKFHPDASSTNRNQNNDLPFLRFSDIILMKAEAVLRGGTATSGQTALILVNMIRENRSTSPAWTSVTLEDIYKERSREFVYESWHRNDMIRFGKYEDSWGFKTNSDTYRRIFPIPTGAIVLNPELTQNPGY